MKIALAQIDPTIGDFTGNLAKIVEVSRRAAEQGARLAVFSELCVCGYLPADFLEKPSFLERCRTAVDELAAATRELPVAILVGAALKAPEGAGKPAVNAAFLIDKGQILLEQHKRLLPFYDVFDEQRYFSAGNSQKVVELDGVRLAVSVCEDAWNDKNFWPQPIYSIDPIEELMAQHPQIHINISASPYWHGKRAVRRRMLSAIAKRDGIPVMLSNQVGGNDSLICDGSSLAINAQGQLVAQAKSFDEDLLIVDPFTAPGIADPDEDDTEGAYHALVLGTRDYVRKCGFKKAIVALSGGIDSALVAAIAKDALGAENVLGIGMPSPYSSQGSIDDSKRLAANLRIRFEVIGISNLFSGFTEALEPFFAGKAADLTEENIQPRIRGTLLMALSNKLGALVLTTGNKSEMAVGYCTLYGDMVGALAVIGDLMKLRVYALCRWLNRDGEVIPEAILTKPPSAELRPGQMDTDSLPPYEVLDPILEAYVERYETPEAIAETHGFSRDIVQQVVRLVERSEYKRQQAAPVLKVTSKSFGMGRRFPIAVKVQV
ncbi:NAD+ synthase [Occallatibacter riparius]|uniref:Glutamine-dependent NAD(+) synthetase n=1 Tax=Occallatibacter riparius TaxID=1002689 RepID=A0A9J7BJM4_9BACT|nr:NAD+ synthase [Occallatibacter riparius]UWZ82665.1 NAD+ synthase [Occallatibacter riparius]